jgi:peptidoglycan/LPS O-acetylase OafA/YrhL
METQRHKFIVLDGLRGIAAISVVYYHMSSIIASSLIPNALLAVDFFFILSGFVIAYSYEKKLSSGMALSDFVKIRLIRLYPLYLVGITLPLLLIISQHFSASDQTSILFAFADYILEGAFLPTPPMISVKPSSAFPLNGVSWSLSAEIWINFIYAVFLPFLTTRRLLIVTFISGVLLILTVHAHDSMGLGWGWGNYCGGWARVIFGFPMGILLYRLFDLKKPSPLPIWLGVALPPILMTVFFTGTEAAPYMVAFPLFLFPWIVWIGARINVQGCVERACSKLGELSYALYITHFALSKFIVLSYDWLGVNPSAHLRINSIIWTATAILVAWICDVLYDIPIRERIKNSGFVVSSVLCK